MQNQSGPKGFQQEFPNRSSQEEIKDIKVLVYGLGFIGRMIVEAIQAENPFWNQRLVVSGAVDIVPESREWAKKRKIPAYEFLDDYLKKEKPDVCIHTTASSLKVIVPQLKDLIQAGIPVVSSCEELFFPWIQNHKTAVELDELCKTHKVALLGSGVNPGFVMDVLPAIVTQVVHTVDFIRVERVVNAASRRPPLQKKIGAGLDGDTFRAQVAKRKIGHIGLNESLDFLAAFLGFRLTKRGEKLEPVLAPRTLATRALTLKKGQVAGLHQIVWGEVDKKRVIELDLKISLTAENPLDQVTIQGSPPVTLTVDGGTQGDPGTVAALVRGVPIVLKARPGLVKRLERDHF